MSSSEVSHGRGGAGNMSHDKTAYGDGEVVRAGVEGSHGDGAYSSGRGGAGNIADVGSQATARKDGDMVPVEATRPSHDVEAHTGRGGAGNIEGNSIENEKRASQRQEGVPAPMGLADKLKTKLFGSHKK